MVRSLELEIDVSDAAGLGEPAHVAMTVTLPDPDSLREAPVVCFAKPGGGYSKGYFTTDLPGPSRGAQAHWHAERGWIFVSVDHLGVGSSSTHHDPSRLDYTVVTAASQHAEIELLDRLGRGDIGEPFPPVQNPLKIAIGQSLGGCLTIVQQGRYHWYDGVGVLGFSAIHTNPPVAPGMSPIVIPWIPRDARAEDGIVTNAAAVGRATVDPGSGSARSWAFFYDDVDREIVHAELDDFPLRGGTLPPWGSTTRPGAVVASSRAPGAVAPEAAAITVPVLCAIGERDVVGDPRGEPRAYQSARSVDLFICARMGHMHNFAGTRELLWNRIETWAEWVRRVTPSIGS